MRHEWDARRFAAFNVQDAGIIDCPREAIGKVELLVFHQDLFCAGFGEKMRSLPSSAAESDELAFWWRGGERIELEPSCGRLSPQAKS
jgi:hypothetical protein